MPLFHADLHLHSPYSIAVSQNMNLDTMWVTAQQKGLHILSTGDITQPEWRQYLRDNLTYREGVYSYKNLAFIIGTELEDIESIHHVLLLPDFASADRLADLLSPYIKNITGRWAGRPHVQKNAGDLVEIIESVGGISGPAHAFTPFKAIFRQGKYATLREAYGSAVKKIAFLELGLSADTYMADRMEELQNITFLSNSDAHSEGIASLGREFNRMQLETPSFDEIRMACERRKDRKITLNVGLDPRLGKYHVCFCESCRRRIRIQQSPSSTSSSLPISNSPTSPASHKTAQRQITDYGSISEKTKFNPSISLDLQGFQSYDNAFLYYHFPDQSMINSFLALVSQGKIECHACREIKQETPSSSIKTRKIPSIKLGVSERINEIASWDNPHSPAHRPPYLDIVPLVELLSKMYQIKSQSSSKLTNIYARAVTTFGSEYSILIDTSISALQTFDPQLASVIEAFREKKIEYIPGGGGKFGEIRLDRDE